MSIQLRGTSAAPTFGLMASRARAGPALAAILVTLALALAACTGSDSKDGPAEQATSEAPATAEPPSTPAEQSRGSTTPSPFPGLTRELRVGLVTDARGLNDHGFNAEAHKGLRRAIVDFEVEAEVLESASVEDYVSNLTALAEAANDLVIGVGPGMAAALRDVAEEHPETQFAILDFDYPLDERLPNIQGIVFNESEVGYVAGYLAGLVSETGAVAVLGPLVGPSARGYVTGFERGVADAAPGVAILRSDVQEAADCGRVATSAIADDADVIFPLTLECSESALDAAREHGIWGIGVDVDQSFLGAHVLTSAVKRIDVAVWDTVQAVLNGVVEDAVGTMSPYRLKGGDVVVYGMSYEGVGIGPVSAAIDPTVLGQVDRVAEEIQEGFLDLPRDS